MAPRKNYTPEQIEKAVEAVKNGEKVAVAAQRFGVPRITLHDKITGKTPIGCAMGPSTILTKSEEDILERWLLTLAEKHFPLTKDSLMDSVQKILINQNRPNPFTNNRPGKKWFQSFMKRHPNLSQRVPDNLSRARDNVTENNIRTWFNEIESYLDENNLKTVLNYPHRLFNTDESITVYSAQKLHQFNKLYFENRSTLESNIPNEDVALYFIWAKNKSELGCHSNSSDAASKSDPLEETNRVSNNTTTAQMNEVLTEESLVVSSHTGLAVPTVSETSVQTENSSKDANSNDFTESVSSRHNLKKSVDAAFGMICSLPVAEEVTLADPIHSFEPLSSTNLRRPTGDHLPQQPNYSTKVDTVINQPLPQPVPSSPTDLLEVTRDPLVEQFNINTNIETTNDHALQPPESSSSSDLSKRIKDPISHEPIISTMVLQDTTPHKKSMESVLGVVVPSPFKRSLFWPENLDINKKKMKREKIPSTVTSKAWQEYHERKEAEKNKKQREKEERAKQRIENKKLKEQLANDTKNKIYRTKTAKTKVKRRKIIQEELTSDSDMEISYAESDISYDEPGSLNSDLENSPLINLPSSKATKLKKNKTFSIGSFVIIKYEGEYFPGKVESLRKNEFEINTMTLTTGNTFKWPNPPDKMFYGRMDIIEGIKEPICLNKRGFYRVPEMDKYLPNIYDFKLNSV